MAFSWGLEPQGVYWEVERDTLIAIPLFIFMGIMLQRSKIAEDLLVTMAQLFGPFLVVWAFRCFRGRPVGRHNGHRWCNCGCNGHDFTACDAAQQIFPIPCDRDNCGLGTLGQIIPPSIVLIICGPVGLCHGPSSTARKALYKNPQANFRCHLSLMLDRHLRVKCSLGPLSLAYCWSVFI